MRLRTLGTDIEKFVNGNIYITVANDTDININLLCQELQTVLSSGEFKKELQEKFCDTTPITKLTLTIKGVTTIIDVMFCVNVTNTNYIYMKWMEAYFDECASKYTSGAVSHLNELKLHMENMTTDTFKLPPEKIFFTCVTKLKYNLNTGNIEDKEIKSPINNECDLNNVE